ncbi:hypothetical protein T4D_10032 [Trichinella pseudospiralis]|uniref:Uncharacterized protein n=1 Tax=Trichinella pseudospiralis TaxID=6337 RepID=A0A0V1FA32_TRIPS|nr:hypothetical protein T4D_10032 [Trichinella pseudospiralis]
MRALLDKIPNVENVVNKFLTTAKWQPSKIITPRHTMERTPPVPSYRFKNYQHSTDTFCNLRHFGISSMRQEDAENATQCGSGWGELFRLHNELNKHFVKRRAILGNIDNSVSGLQIMLPILVAQNLKETRSLWEADRTKLSKKQLTSETLTTFLTMPTIQKTPTQKNNRKISVAQHPHPGTNTISDSKSCCARHTRKAHGSQLPVRQCGGKNHRERKHFERKKPH